MANLGNAWHLPDNPEPSGLEGMRSPVEEIFPETAVTVVSGNQSRGPGRSGDQRQGGSSLSFRRATDASWSVLPLRFVADAANNTYYSATIPANTFRAGDLTQYYFRLEYNDRDPTFLAARGSGSRVTDSESAARASPFAFEVRQPLRPSGGFLAFDSGDLQARVYRDTGHVELAGPDLAGTPHANVVTFGPPAVRLGGQPRALGRVLASTARPDGLDLDQEFAGSAVRARLTFPHPGVMRYEVTDWRGQVPDQTSVAAASSGAERFYGLGEKFNRLDQSGKIVRMETFDQPGNKGDRSYKVVPWFISTRGYGLHFDSTAESIFDLRAGREGRYSISNPSDVLAFHVVYGPRLTDVLTRFTGYVGRPPLPPPFAFGPWISSDLWRSGGEVRYAVTKWRERGIPGSVFVFDSPWETSYNDFRFNMTQFGNKGRFEGEEFDGFASLDEMMRFFQQHGLKVVCWMTPFINPTSKTGEVPGQLGRAANLEDGKLRGVFVRTGDGEFIETGWWKGKGFHVDWTDPEARVWIQDQLKALVAASRVATRSGAEEPAIGGFKTDDGEALTNANSPDTTRGTYLRTDARFADGRTGREMRNGYCVEYHRAVWEVLSEDGLIFARSGFTGTQAHPGCWAGDNQPNFGEENGLPSVIVAGLSAAMSGFSIWGHDIGGYLNNNFSQAPIDLFRRWTQFGCFSPIMQLHRQVFADPGDLRQYPWGYPGAGETVGNNAALDHFRFYATLHTALFPYIYTYAKRASETGLPILRPLVLIHQDDPRSHAVQHTFYFGEEFLVAPVIRPDAKGRGVYLPEGAWVDFWTNELHPGRNDLDWENRDPARFPLFVRRGSIIPMLLSDVDTLCDANYVNNPTLRTPDEGLLFLVYPSGTARFQVHDGTTITCTATDGASVLELTSRPRPIRLRILGPRPPAVERDDAPMTEHLSRAAFEASSAGWHADLSEGTVLIRFEHNGGSTILRI